MYREKTLKRLFLTAVIFAVIGLAVGYTDNGPKPSTKAVSSSSVPRQ